jgi:hypothetical protein
MAAGYTWNTNTSPSFSYVPFLVTIDIRWLCCNKCHRTVIINPFAEKAELRSAGGVVGAMQQRSLYHGQNHYR